MAKIITRAAALVGTLPRSIKKSGKPIRSAAPKHTICRFVRLHIPDREPRLHGVLAPPCRKGAPLFHEQF